MSVIVPLRNSADSSATTQMTGPSAAIRSHPLLKGVKLPDRLGTPGGGGLLVTQNGLILIGGGDPYLYAFDKRTGKELSRVPTTLRTNGNPMTYRARNGRQYVAVQSGWGIDARAMQGRLNRIQPGNFPDVPEGGAVWVFAVK